MRWIIYILCLLPAVVRAQQVESLLQSLADPDSAKRQAAEAQLARLGPDSRPALITASRGADPAIASAAARALLALPWYRATDPLQVQQLLSNYGREEEPRRIAIIGQLARMSDFTGLPAMLRLLQEDPNEDVAWNVLTLITRSPNPALRPLAVTHPVVQEQIRHLNPPDNRPAALVLGAYGWIGRDRPKALDMLRRAVETETRYPTYDNGELDFAFDCLVDAAIVGQKYDEAADFRRLQTTRIGVTRASFPSPVYQLFLLHARYGPLQGFEGDLQAQSAFLGDSEVMYAIAEAYARSGRKFEAMVLRETAWAASISLQSRGDATSFLVASGWIDLARREYYAILAGDDPTMRFRSRTLLALASLASRDDADAVAISHYEALLNLALQPGAGWEDEVDRRDELNAEILWRQARIALAKGDKTDANTRFDALMKLQPADTDVVQHSYPMLLGLNRPADAEKLFQLAYERLSESMVKAPDAPVWWNDLAWLCARCDQKLDEALELSNRAVTADPDNASYIDTLAEVYFRKGQAAEAVKLETRALQIEPGDIFMTKQIERFRAGVKR